MSRWIRAVGLALGLLAAIAPQSRAQSSTGSIYGTVTDASGAAIPGATVSLTGPAGARSTTSGENGGFRFLNVDHGTYRVGVTLTGFTAVNRDVAVNAGQNVDIPVLLGVASLEETVVVTAETPVVDTKRVGTAITIPKDELARIPSSRDPWALMRTVPGVLVDRVNVAGSESGQQSNFVGKGADPKDSVWTLDGVVVTDMSAIGSSPDYFTYDAFDEVSFQTGGNDVRMATGGIGVGLVTKRGTNDFHGSAGGYYTSDDLQWSNLPDELVGDPRLQGSDKADHTDKINEYSFDLGGPILKDKLWFYGSYGHNDIHVRRLTQSPDVTRLKSITGKLNWQAGQSDMVSLFYFQGAKTKTGRSGSSGSLQHTEGTLWDQTKVFPGDPPGFSKVEWNHIFSPSLNWNVKGAYYSTGFGLEAQGGTDGVWILDNVAGVARGTADTQLFGRPQYTLNTEGSYFTSGLGGNHELRLGGGWRRSETTTDRVFPGEKYQIRYNPSSTRARFYRDQSTKVRNDYLTAYLSDTFTRGRLTLTGGARFDHQTGENAPTSVGANPLLPSLLPALDFAGGGDGVSWTDVSPRLGLTYSLDQGRKTLLRASFARYAGQLPTGDGGWDNPLGTTFLEYDWRDANADEIVQLGEVDLQNLRNFSGVDPNDPGAVAASVHEIDPDYHSNKDTEIVAGLERELMPNLSVSAAYTWRKSTDLTASQLLSGYYWYSWIGVTSADYHQGAPVTANGFTATPYVVNDGVADRISGGLLLRNRPDFSRTFQGVELSFVKRMANNWMGRAALSFNDWKEEVGPGALINPSHTDLDPQIDGGQSIPFSAGSGKNYYTNAKWQVNINGLYQLPAGFEIAANLFGRQGYPKPVYMILDTGALDGELKVLAVSEADQERLPDLWNLDARLAKNFTFGKTHLILAGELFNALNANTALYRNPQANGTTFNRLDEILAPRIARLSARISF
jgi:hypothetical protein